MKFSGKTYFDLTDNLQPSPWLCMGEGGHLKLNKITQQILCLKWVKMVPNGKKWKKNDCWVKVGLGWKFCKDLLRISGDIEGGKSVTYGHTHIQETLAKFI